MANINVTLRLVKKYFESSPVWTTWEQMQINKIEFHIQDLAGERLIVVDVPLTDRNASEFISASATLAQNTEYLAFAIAYSPFHPTGVQSEKVQFKTDDTVTYYNFETVIRDKDTLMPIPGAQVVFDAAGINKTVIARHDGLVWIQRIPAGTYTVAVTAAGYVAVNTTWTAEGLIKPFIIMTPVP